VAQVKAGVWSKQVAGYALMGADAWAGAAGTSVHSTWSRDAMGIDGQNRVFGLGTYRGGKRWDLEPAAAV
jgi:hypothetical protein